MLSITCIASVVARQGLDISANSADTQIVHTCSDTTQPQVRGQVSGCHL